MNTSGVAAALRKISEGGFQLAHVAQLQALTEARFWVKVEFTGTCWLWRGATSAGYGHFQVEGRRVPAHRVSYEWENGPIPPGLVIDHLCRVTQCVNPSHLEAVTQRENLLRAPSTLAARMRRVTHCPRGHAYEGQALLVTRRGSRMCRTCDNARRRHARLVKNRRVSSE